MSAPTVNPATPPEQERRSGLAKWIRRLAIPIIIGWVLLVAVLNTAVPQLEVVGQMRSVSMSPSEAPSVIAMKRVGEVFEEFKSDSSAMIVLEGDQPLGAEAHRYYDELVDRLEADTKHVEHVQDFWGDPLTEAGAQSSDGKATYVQVFLAGNMGEALSNESVLQVKSIVDGLPPPPGVKVFVTGGSALVADQQIASDRSIRIIEMVTFAVIITMLLLVYRSIRTVLLVLVMVFLTLSATRGVVAFLGYHELIGLSTFATNLLVTLAIAAATDYAIFLIGRYQEARTIGEDRESAYYTMFHGTAHVVLGSGMTIAGATFCLSFTRLPYFQSLGVPLAVGMATGVLVALTLGPAIITVASRFGLLEPKRAMRIRGWRKIGAAHRPLAGSGPARDDRTVPRRPAHPARVSAQLQRPQVPAGRPACQSGVRGGRTAFLARDDEPGVAAHRERPRPSQLGGLPGDRQDRQGRLPGARHRPRPGDHPSQRQTRRVQHDSGPDEPRRRRSGPEPQVPAKTAWTTCWCRPTRCRRPSTR